MGGKMWWVFFGLREMIVKILIFFIFIVIEVVLWFIVYLLGGKMLVSLLIVFLNDFYLLRRLRYKFIEGWWFLVMKMLRYIFR